MSAPLRVAAAVIVRDGRVLLTQRPPGATHGLLWEFPGGKIEPGENAEAALAREIREELGIGSRTSAVLGTTRYTYPHGLDVEITFLRCELDSFEFTPSAAVAAARWVRPVDVALDELLAADREFLRTLAASDLASAPPRAGS